MAKSALANILNLLKRKEINKFDSRAREAYVIGYPKTGTTWLRVMLAKYVQLLIGRDEKLPLPLFDQFENLDPCVPPIQFTHGPLLWTDQTAADLSQENVVMPYSHAQVVLLVRSFPDVLVSDYWQHKTQVTPPYSGEISDFIRDPVLGVEKAITFYRLWYEGRHLVSKLILTRYEDLRFRPTAEFRRLLGFWQIPINEDYLAQAVAFGNFDNMRKLEVDNKQTRKLVYFSSGFPIFATGDTEKTQEAFHVRKGQVGGYREYLSESDIQFLCETMHGRIPEWYGYPNGFWEEHANPK